MTDRSDIVARAFAAIAEDQSARCRDIIRSEYPFQATPAVKRSYTLIQSLRVFRGDGFVDRYTGKRLVNPGALRILSLRVPEEFPAHPNWKMAESHVAFWELFPTVDHVVPVARGGRDDPSNWVTTSMFSNSAKGNALLEELGWSLRPPGDPAEWDGLSSQFLSLVRQHSDLMSDRYLARWYRATAQSLA